MPGSRPQVYAVVADVGGTHIRFGTLTDRDAPLRCIASFRCAGFDGLEAALTHYVASPAARAYLAGGFEVLCLALPGDVQSVPIDLVNLGWRVEPATLAQRFSCRLLPLNDFTAQAHAIGDLESGDLDWLRTPAGPVDGLNRAVIGPGTGLGAAALMPDGQVLESEAGHISFAPQSDLQQRLLASLWPDFPRLSVERLLSGPGLANIYRALARVDGRDSRLTAEEITSGAQQGDPACLATVLEFNRIFGSVCGDIALAFGAKGGVYLSGGMLAGLDTLFDRSIFLQQFDFKGRYGNYCRQIPVARVIHPHPGLAGAARYARLHADNGN